MSLVDDVQAFIEKAKGTAERLPLEVLHELHGVVAGLFAKAGESAPAEPTTPEPTPAPEPSGETSTPPA